MKRLSLLVVLMMVPCLVQAASFDCSKARTPVDKLICGDEQISKLDSELSNVYDYVLSYTRHSVKRSTLIADQKNWIMTARDKCNDVNCLRDAYRTRTKVLTMIKTDKSEACYVVDKNERSAITAEFQRDIKHAGITGTLSECNLMVELIGHQGGHDQSYGAICELNERSVMICNDTMVGKLTLTFTFIITGDTVADFTEKNCPPGG